MLIKLYLTQFFLLSLQLYTFGCSDKELSCLNDLESKYKIKIYYKSFKEVIPKEWTSNPINANLTKISNKELKRFPRLLKEVLYKYPHAVILKNLKGVCLAKKMTFYGTQFGATNSIDIIYLTSGGENNGYTNQYLYEAFHHEFSSILLRNYNFPRNKWLSCNPKDFKYKGGGVQAIKKNIASQKGTKSLYKKGFLAQYSLSDFEEDFNLYSEMIFVQPKIFKSLSKEYKAIDEKFKIWLSFYQSIDKSFTQDFFFNSSD